MSFGLRRPSKPEDLERWEGIVSNIAYELDQAGSTVILAAGSNEGQNKPRAFPASHPKVICVHASDGNGIPCGLNPSRDTGDPDHFMTLGASLRLLSLDGSSFTYNSGTSLATAVAAGIVANLLEISHGTNPLSRSAKRMLRTSEGMKKMFRIMSPEISASHYTFVAPWLHWPEGWAIDEDLSSNVWSIINTKLRY